MFTKRPMNSEHQRFCSGKCGEILPLTDENFYRRKTGSQEFHYKCKSCLRAVTKVQSQNRRYKAAKARRIEVEKPIVIRTTIDGELYRDAKTLCGLTHAEITQMIADIGISGLSNYVHDQHNWID